MFYEKNRAALVQHPWGLPLIHQLESVSPTGEASVIQTPEGSDALQYKEIFLNDCEKPLAEAASLSQECNLQEVQSCQVVFGLELGHLVRALFRQATGTIYVLEPDLALLRYLLETQDYSEIFNTAGFFLFPDPDPLLLHIRQHTLAANPLAPLKLVTLQGYHALFGQEIAALKTKLEPLNDQAALDIEIVKVQHAQWIETFFSNIPHLVSALPMNPLKDRFLNKPALVVSSGPSLDDALEEIKRLQDQVVIFSVGRSLRTLLEAGIIPDFTLFADYTGIEAHVAHLPETVRHTNFILPAFGDPQCFKTPSLRKFVMLGHNIPYLADWLDTTLETSYLRMQQIAPVSIAALESAFVMGCDPILLIGQDLAYRGNQIYAGNIHATLDETAGTSILEGHETLGANYAQLGQILGQNGTMLMTNIDYVLFAQQLEERAEANAKNPTPRRLINASVGGAYLKGFQHLSLTEFIQHHPLPILDKRLPDLPLSTVDDEKGYALMLGLTHVGQATRQARLAASELLEAAATLEKLPIEAWPGPLEIYQTKQKAFAKLVARHPYLMPCIYDNLIEHQIREADQQSPHHKIAWVQRYYIAAHEGFQKLLSWVLEAESQLGKFLAGL